MFLERSDETIIEADRGLFHMLPPRSTFEPQILSKPRKEIEFYDRQYLISMIPQKLPNWPETSQRKATAPDEKGDCITCSCYFKIFQAIQPVVEALHFWKYFDR